jgi:hypothetical protein
MIFDGSKEQTTADFKCKLRETDCHGRQTEPYSPWQQAAEGCIRELKRGTSRKMIKTGSPKTLWDHCLELEALVRSSTSNDIYMTNGEVPENIMTGSTAEISHISEFGWYDWVMFRDNTPTYPNPKLILGRYLGPATSSSLRDKCQKAFISALTHSSNLQADVTFELSSIGLHPEEEFLTRTGYRLDALVEVKEAKVGIVEFDGPSHFVGRKAMGWTLLKHRQVSILDKILVVSVPYLEWNILVRTV